MKTLSLEQTKKIRGGILVVAPLIGTLAALLSPYFATIGVSEFAKKPS